MTEQRLQPPYDPSCVECRRDAGKDSAGTTWQCVGHVYLERDRLRADLAQARAERDETLMIAEHPEISNLRDLARELAYRGQRISELEAVHTPPAAEALVPCCASASCEYCGGTGMNEDWMARNSLTRHPILRGIHDACQAVEACGASVALTHAVTTVGDLMEPARVLLDERDAARAEVARLTAERDTPAGSCVLAFDLWANDRVKRGARPFTQDEYAAAQEAFYAAHPGDGPHSTLMATPDTLPPLPSGWRLVRTAGTRKFTDTAHDYRYVEVFSDDTVRITWALDLPTAITVLRHAQQAHERMQEGQR